MNKINWTVARRAWYAYGAALFVPMIFIGQTAIAGAGGAIKLYNDSPFILTATLQGSDGSFLAENTVQPGQQSNFVDNFQATYYDKPGNPSVSLTPYTVIWQCPSEGFYSMCTSVSPGALVQANICPGYHFCKPKQKPTARSESQ